jgi:hypothetical protein
VLTVEVLVDFAAPGFVANFVAKTLVGMAEGYAPAFGLLGLPGLYQSGIRFRLPREHGTGLERFKLPHQLLKEGYGDCDQLVLYRLSELYSKGERASCRAVWEGPNVHVLVRRASGALEDPSLKVGHG